MTKRTITVYVADCDESVWRDAATVAKQEGTSLSSLVTDALVVALRNQLCLKYPDRIDEIFAKGPINFKP